MPLDTINPATLMSGRFKQEDIPDLSGRTALVTGGSAGIGCHDALGLARAGAKVIIISSDAQKGENAVSEMTHYLKEQAPASKGSVLFHQVDLADLKATDAFAQKFASEEDRLDILINNAAVGQAPFGMTADGIERHFEINNLATFVLTLRVLPLMQKTSAHAAPATVRVVMQSSEMHRMAPNDVQFASLDEINEERDGAVLYGRTKLGLILFARGLVKRKLADSTIVVTSVHPGTVDTDMQEAWNQSYGIIGQALNAVTRAVGKSAPEGAEASLWAATSTGIDASSFHKFQGNYYSEAHGKPHTESLQAQDPALADAFWEFASAQAKRILGEDIN